MTLINYGLPPTPIGCQFLANLSSFKLPPQTLCLPPPHTIQQCPLEGGAETHLKSALFLSPLPCSGNIIKQQFMKRMPAFAQNIKGTTPA